MQARSRYQLKRKFLRASCELSLLLSVIAAITSLWLSGCGIGLTEQCLSAVTCKAATTATLAFSASSGVVSESAGTVAFSVLRTGGASGAASVTYETVNGTATAGTAYTAATGILSWADGDSSPKSILVPILNQNLTVGSQSFTVNLISATGASIGTPAAIAITITDNDSIPGTLALSNSTYSVNEAAGTVTLSVTRIGGSSGAASVNYATANGTAVAGMAYSAISGILSWADGDGGSKSITVPILNQGFTTGTQGFSVNLSGATDAAIGMPAIATVTIDDNDMIPGTLAFGAPTYNVNEQAGTVTLAVTRVGGTSGVATVNYATVNGTAVAGTAYTASIGTLDWADGDGSAKSITVPILNQQLTSGTQSFSVALSGGTGAGVGTPATATVSITDNDVLASTLAFGAPTYSVNEAAGTVTLSVKRTGGSSGAASVDYSTGDGTGVAGKAYTTAVGTLTWGAGDDSSKLITVSILNQQLTTGIQTFTVNLNGAVGAALQSPSTAEVTIVDNDMLPGNLQFSASGYSVSETAGTVALSVSRTGGTTGAVSVNYSTTNGAAVAGTAYTAAAGSLTWTDGEGGSKVITVPILNQQLSSGSESFTVNLSGAVGAALGSPSTSIVTIVDDNMAPSVIQLASPTYTTSESAGSLVLTVDRNGNTSGSISVSFTTVNGSAIGGMDYTSETGTLTWAAGDDSPKLISIPILDQGVTNGSKTFNVVLSSPVGGATLGIPSIGLVTINDNDSVSGVIELAASSYSTTESSGSIVISVIRKGATNGAISVSFSTLNGTAVSGTDFTKTVGVLTWASGNNVPQTVTIPISNSGSEGGLKNFQLILSSPTGGATLGSPSTSVITINDNDTFQEALQFDSSSYLTTETSGSVVLAVSRVGSSAGAVSVTYATSNGTATAGVGYMAQTGMLNWANGDTDTKSITIPISDVNLTTGSQTFKVNLVSATNGAAIGDPSSAVVKIMDNDVASTTSILEFSDAQVYTYEGATALLTVTRTGGSASAISVNYATSDNTAVAGTDYTASKGTLTWAANDASARTISIPILEGQIYEGARGFTVNLSGVVGEAVLGSPASSIVTIGAAGTVQFSSNAFETSEGAGSIPLTVTRTAGSNGAISVTYTTHDGSALAGTDYSSISSTLVWNSTDNSAKTIVVPILNPHVNGNSRTFTVTLGATTGGASLGSVSSTAVAISDDLSRPGALQFTQRTFVAQENSGSIVLNVNRVSGAKGQIAVNFSTLDGTGQAGTDYSQSAGNLTWADGETGIKQISIPIMDLGHWDGGTKVFSVSLSDPTNGAVLGTPTTATVDIAENDKSAGSITLLSPSYTLTETSGSLDVTVQRVNGYNGSVRIAYTTGDGTALAPTEYAAQRGTFTWADGDTTSRTITIPIVDAKISGGSHIFTVSLSNPTGGAVIGANPITTITIADSDATKNACPTLPTITLGVGEDGAGGKDLTGNISPEYPACSSNFQLYGTTVSASGITSEGGNDYFYGQYGNATPIQYNINIPSSTNVSTLFDNRLGYSQGYTVVMESEGNTPNYEVIAIPSANIMNNGWLNTYPLTYQTQAYTNDATQTVVLMTNSEPSSQIINNGTIGDFYVTSEGAYTNPQNPANPNQQNYTPVEITAGALFINNGTVTNTSKGYLGSANSIFTSGAGTIYNYGAIAGQNDGIISAFTSYNYDNGGVGLSNLGFASIHAYNNVYNYGYILGQDYGVLLEGNNTVIDTYGGLPVPGVTDFLGRQVFNGEISCQVFPSHRTVTDPDRLSVNPVMMDGNGETLNLISRSIDGTVYLPVIVSEMDGGFNGNFSNSKANVLNTLNFNFSGLSISDYRTLMEAINQSEQQNANGTFYTGSASIQGISYNWSGFAYVNFTGIPPE